MTEELLGCPQNIEMMWERAASVSGICFKCRKGEGLICAAAAQPAAASLSLSNSIFDTW